MWSRALGREVAWVLALKFAVLALLWILFFSPSHRHAVDGESASRQFGVAAESHRD